MGGSTDKAAAIRLLRGLEGGGMSSVEARTIAEGLDPVLLFVVVRYLREAYPASHPAATAVLDRVVALTAAWPGLVARSKEGERDPVAEWFSRDHSFVEFRGRGAEMLGLIVEKLES
jgi:hypothetical protein